MSKETPNYYSIIPSIIRYDKNLKANEKLLYGEITALSNKNGYCYASNDYFANLYGVSKTSISKWISNLEKNKHIKRVIVYKKGGKQILNRYLTIVQYPIEEKLNTPIEEKLKDNNTSINNTSIIKEKIYKKEFSFSLSKKCKYENLSSEYKKKLKAKCLLADGDIARYEDFITQLEAKGYQYVNFYKAYLAWDKDKLYKRYNPKVEPLLGDDWRQIVLSPTNIIAINVKTLEMKEAKIKEKVTFESPTQTKKRDISKLIGASGCIQKM